MKQRRKFITPSWLGASRNIDCCPAGNNCIISVTHSTLCSSSTEVASQHHQSIKFNFTRFLGSSFHIALRCQILSQCLDRVRSLRLFVPTEEIILMPCNTQGSAKFIQSNWSASIKIASKIMIHIGFQKCFRNSKHLTRCFFSISLSPHFSLRIVTLCSLNPLHSCASATFSIERC